MVAQLPEQTKKHCIVQLKWVNCIVYKLHLGRGDKGKRKKSTVKVYQRHQAGGGLGSVLTNSVMEFHAGGGERSPYPISMGSQKSVRSPLLLKGMRG